jgi:hypothetical protein
VTVGPVAVCTVDEGGGADEVGGVDDVGGFDGVELPPAGFEELVDELVEEDLVELPPGAHCQ